MGIRVDPGFEDLEYLGEMNEISYSTKSTVEEYLKQNTLRHENILQPIGYYRKGSFNISGCFSASIIEEGMIMVIYGGTISLYETVFYGNHNSL